MDQTQIQPSPRLASYPRPDSPFLQPGENCWKTAQAKQLSILIDAENYFLAFRSILNQAKKYVMILAWDIDTRIILNPGKADYARRITLEKAFYEALNKNPDLNIYILCWDFAMIYTLKWKYHPLFRRTFSHPRIHFILDAHHPFGASQHQKIVVADDEIAFVGGLDLCQRRWDTRKHRPFDRRRIDPDHRKYFPFHDIQTVFNGEAARWVSVLAKERWKKATGIELVHERTESHLWPEEVRPDFENIPIGIARTGFSSKIPCRVREIEKLFVDSIYVAKQIVYIENQYFTSHLIAQAILKRIKEKDSPEFLILTPRFNAGWIEESTMAVLRARWIHIMKKQDPYGKLRFYYPVTIGKYTVPISLHSKMMIVDHTLLHTGSANLNNRSMGLDSECDIVVESESTPHPHQVREDISRIRNSLLAEHLGCSPIEVEAILQETGSLFQVIDRLNLRDHALRAIIPFSATLSWWVNRFTPDLSVLDPDRPVDEDTFFSYYLPEDKNLYRRLKYRQTKRKLFIVTLLSTLLFLNILPFHPDLIQIYREIQASFETFHPLGITLVGFLAGSVFLLPLDVLIFWTCLLRPHILGASYSMTGILLVGFAIYCTGALMGKIFHFKEQASESLKSAQFSRFWSHFLMQLNLFAPFVLLCFRAGRISSPLKIFFPGLFMGQLFRVGIVSIYSNAFHEMMVRPDFARWLLVLGISVLILLAARWSNHRFLPTYD